MLSDKGIDPREVLRLEPGANGTQLVGASDIDQQLVQAGYTVADVMLSKTSPASIEQLALFEP